MAVQTSTTIKTQLHSLTNVVEWTGLQAGDTGDWNLLAHYRDKCLHVFGTLGGAIVTLEGTNEDVSPSNPATLRDNQQNEIALTVPGLKQILENPLYVRPKVAGGDDTTDVTVRLVCRA